MSAKLEFIPLHDTFVAECRGIDWTEPISQETKDQVQQGIDKVNEDSNFLFK
jgi:alpha-ketoglutarate-dependent 2,4-dichlorophenoxyacetate dioxygenase